MIELCLEEIPTRSAYQAVHPHLCQCIKGHTGRHQEFHYLSQLKNEHRAIAEKIKRDATMTTGAAWKSEEAGPNRILRWVMLLSDDELKTYGVNMNKLKPQVVAKLREKAANYENCMEVAKKLTWVVYQMKGALTPDSEIAKYLEDYFGPMKSNSATCIICRDELPFSLFAKAQRGKAEIETGHMNPRLHNATNVGFAHRECNIAQGNKTLSEFYTWIREILYRVEVNQSSYP
jgi:hypothetical protein